MMRTTILVTALLVSMLSASAVYAQRVELTLFEGHPVINCDGMSPLAYTTTPKGNTEAVLKTEIANATVYKRFAVHKSDNSGMTSWFDAFDFCSRVGNGGWRPPTQRELMLIWVLKPELEKTNGFIKFDTNYYLNATEHNSIDHWFVYFVNGITYRDSHKSTPRGLRCIKELPL